MTDTRQQQPADDTERPKRSAGDLIVELALERFELARADDGEPFAIERGGPNVARMFRGGRSSLRALLAAIYADRIGKVPPAQSLADALNVLEGLAMRAPRRRLALRADRIAADVIVIDIGDDTGRVILVGSDGWSIRDRSPITFRRSELTQALPTPTPGTIDNLNQVINVEADDLSIAIAHQVAALCGVPVPIILLRGPQGAAKTSTAKALALCVDPSPAPVRSVPRDQEAWAVTAGGSFVVVLDNIDTIPDWLSDALCRAVTGEGYLRRALYTDGAISVVAFRRAIVMTGIDPGAMRGDLSDRLVEIDLLGIDDRDREEDAVMAARLADAHPAILGAILDITANVLAILPEVHLERKPRMADFGRILAAVDRILETNALDRYMAQRGKLQREAAEGDPIGAAIIAFMSARSETWAGTATELLDAIRPERPGREWPKTGRGMSAMLRRLATSLRAADVIVTMPDDQSRQGHARDRIVTLEHADHEPSASASGDADGWSSEGPKTAQPSANRPHNRPHPSEVDSRSNQANGTPNADDADGSSPLSATRARNGENGHIRTEGKQPTASSASSALGVCDDPIGHAFLHFTTSSDERRCRKCSPLGPRDSMWTQEVPA